MGALLRKSDVHPIVIWVPTVHFRDLTVVGVGVEICPNLCYQLTNKHNNQLWMDSVAVHLLAWLVGNPNDLVDW